MPHSLKKATLRLVAVALWFFSFSKSASAATWYFPMDQYQKRIQVKDFGTLVNDQFYQGKETLFPYNRFYGYHAGVDLEVWPEEKNQNVPVFAIHSGTLAYIGSLPGYGGVILEKLEAEDATVLYGHVKIANLSFRVGDHIAVADKPVMLTFLGDAFSAETSNERKHLHFGIYRGTALYFHGHEESLATLRQKWYDPSVFLKERGTQESLPAVTDRASLKREINLNKKDFNFFSTLFRWIKTLLKRE